MRMNVCQCFKYGVRLYCMAIIKLVVYLGFTVNEVFLTVFINLPLVVK
jgi:hypothetical protein